MSVEKVRLKKASAIVAEQMVGSRLSEREVFSALTAVGLIKSGPGNGNRIRNGIVIPLGKKLSSSWKTRQAVRRS